MAQVPPSSATAATPAIVSPTTPDPAEVDKVVLSYLRKRGFKTAESAFASEAKVSGRTRGSVVWFAWGRQLIAHSTAEFVLTAAQILNVDEFASALAEDNEQVMNTIMIAHPIEVRPGRYDETYSNLRSWMDGSLDAYKVRCDGRQTRTRAWAVFTMCVCVLYSCFSLRCCE